MAKKKRFNNKESEKDLLKSITVHIEDAVERRKAINQLKQEAKKAEELETELRAKAKPKEELITAVECTVESIVSSTYQGRFTPESEMLYGGHSPSYGTGNYLHSEIKVNTANTPIKTLEFSGWPHIERGDRIRAYVFKGKEEYVNIPAERVRLFIFTRGPGELPPKRIYIERDFQEKETPVKIEKLVNGFVVATYVNK